LKNKGLLVFAIIFGLAATCAFANTEEFSDEFAGISGTVLNKYLAATQGQPAAKAPMEVEIDASVPSLNQHGKLKALRKISDVGKITYRVLVFQGDNTIKSQVIGRYLQAEQQGQDDQNLQVSPANYRFKFKGKKLDDAGNERYVFQLAPLKKRVGLFKGELWLDAHTYLPVVEKGRLVKNPSVFFRKVDFERDFALRNGSAVPAHLSSTINTRLVGKVNLTVNYSEVAANLAKEDDLGDSGLQYTPNDL
jgi:hypothetical protein